MYLRTNIYLITSCQLQAISDFIK